MNRADDHSLVRRCLEGDRKAFEEIVDRYHVAIYNTALRIVNDSDDAADVTQTAFVRVFEKLQTFKFDHKLFSWLYRIAVNEALNHIHRQDRFVELADDAVTANERSADELCDENETGRTIDDALGELKVNYRTVVILYYLEEMSYAEISYILDIPEKTVKSRLFEARNQLRSLLVKRRYSPDA